VASTFSLTSPLGGVGQSGLGRRYGEHGFEEYLEAAVSGKRTSALRATLALRSCAR
jgi:acyl-CoA reductase-like NAD-dependent aldehyde dehydrogenase